MPIKQALGRGLSALIPSAAPLTNQNPVGKIVVGTSGSVTEIPVEKIQPNISQPRKDFDSARQQELVESIRQKGLLQPILVRQTPQGYEIIAGERRYRAAKALGWAKIPALVKNAPPGESLELSLIENIQRENLNPLEEAKAYERLSKEFHMTQEAIAAAVGKDRTSIANAVRLLALPEKIQDKISKNQLSVGHAKILLGIIDRVRQDWLCEKILKEGLSVRQAEQIYRETQPAQTAGSRRQKDQDPHVQMLEEELQRLLGTRVTLVPRGKGGRVQIDYFSSEDLERILNLMGMKKRL